MSRTNCADPHIKNLWHPIGAIAEAGSNVVKSTVLLAEKLSFKVFPDETVKVWYSDVSKTAPQEESDLVKSQCAYGYIWVCLGDDPIELFLVPEYQEPDRRNLNAATMGVHVSAPRAVENFLDMGHFPFVHTDILGVEPHTEVKDYDVEITADTDEIIATKCRFYQPMAAATATSGADVEYIYRVPHPYCSVLYKSSPGYDDRLDVIALFLQPVDEERVRAHMMLSLLDNTNEDKMIRLFQQTIFGQDKPILENQNPKRLPLDPRAEVPIRADKTAIAYRRWLREKGITYGVIVAEELV
ncbi:aromatic ring-hydroxylating dioxygenase subunit alpha [Paenalcaligenes niemegkensis]|uniref:aromatic ring-hydroxylating oxygenase subunit alpha n=1 Tax=Paenalcaligenes niemegkensis TaxID=2895469 RepID=UPI001EE96A87|nr:aromatic ring-hydroxylating dioxygenase subunit alpha [Paenalcaligenes niemegkensis]MCQ9615864.1 aromatic ring-hydroxylating dioxygenase subunit alpha [Paenalcaligenes niemegkensis]